LSPARARIDQTPDAAGSAHAAMVGFAALTATPERRALFARQLREMFEASGCDDPDFLAKLPELVEEFSGNPELLQAVVESIEAQEAALAKDLRAGATGFGRAAARAADAVVVKVQSALRRGFDVAHQPSVEAFDAAIEAASKRIASARSWLAHARRAGARARRRGRGSHRASLSHRSRRARQAPSSPGPPPSEAEPPPRRGDLFVDHERRLGGRP